MFTGQRNHYRGVLAFLDVDVVLASVCVIKLYVCPGLRCCIRLTSWLLMSGKFGMWRPSRFFCWGSEGSTTSNLLNGGS